MRRLPPLLGLLVVVAAMTAAAAPPRGAGRGAAAKGRGAGTAKRSGAIAKKPGAIAKKPGASAKKPVALAKKPGAIAKKPARPGRRPGGPAVVQGGRAGTLGATDRAALLSAILPRAVADPTSPSEQRIGRLREQLAALLGEPLFRRARVGIEVMTASRGDVLFSHLADRPFNPASNTKILATAAAMAALGPDFCYRTTLHGPAPDEAGVVAGDVELRGAGDPSLGVEELAGLARRVAAQGIARIDGDLVADGRFHDPDGGHVGEGALILNRNVYEVRVRPGEPKRPPAVEIEPPLDDFFVVENRAVTVAGKKKTRLRLAAHHDGEGRLVLRLVGRINEAGQVRLRRRVPSGARYAAALMRRALLDFGVEVAGKARLGSLPMGRPLLAEHCSRPLSEVSRVSNKASNNFVADSIFRTLGGERFGLPGTLEKGVRATAAALAPRGLDPASYRIVNGSGLTHVNRLRPAALTQLLRRLYFDLDIGAELVASFAVGGIDGTIRGRFRGTSAVGLVRAKTGTLSGVSALSGYVGDHGDVLCFAILVEGFRKKWKNPIRHAQVRMVEAMLAFLRAEQPAPHPPTEPGAGEPEEPTEDSEADDDPPVGQ